MATAKLRIILSGMIAGDPYHGGASWAVLQYLLGFRQLGHEVVFIEPVQPSSIQPPGSNLTDSISAGYFREVGEKFGLAETSALLLTGTRQTAGLPYDALVSAADQADVLVNISGMLTDERLIGRIPLRIYLDLDPAFNQLWQAAQGIDMRFGAHNRFITIGLGFGQPDCTMPTCGRQWLITHQPIVLSHWPVAQQITTRALTTVGSWRSYGSIEHEGIFYGQRAHSLRRFVDLPMRTRAKFALALAIHPAETKDLAALTSNGWQLLDPAQVARTPASYQRFIQGSWAEFCVAKSGYVASHCGWFSDRSICYLASGRPVIAQETGFSKFLPTGRGLFRYETADDVLTVIDELEKDYDNHAGAARSLAEQYFDSNKVLSRFLQQVGAIA